MSDQTTSTPAAGLSRRTLLQVAAVGGTVVISGAAGAPWAAAAPTASDKRVYVFVIDGCRPGEITAETTPALHALRTGGRWFPQARSMPVAETIPNHTMMMTGVRPDRGSVPANEAYDRTTGEVRTLGEPGDLTFPTVLERLQLRGLTTGSVLSKEYLYTVFGTRATYRWEPFPLVPITNHALDVFTARAFTAMVDASDPHLVFVNFGDIDRFGHSDLSGNDVQLLRRTALQSTDTQIGLLLEQLQARPAWPQTTVIVLADHSMDWSRPDGAISLTPAFNANSVLAGNIAIADNGGADLLTWTGAAAQKRAGLAEATRVALTVPGVLSVRRPAELRLGTQAGDLVVYCKSGFRFSDPAPLSNPIPGNHGHPATEAIPFFIGGGAVAPAVLSQRAATIDVAPTIGKIFGLPAPAGGYDGTARI